MSVGVYPSFFNKNKGLETMQNELESFQVITNYCVTGKPPEGTSPIFMERLADIVGNPLWGKK